MALEGRGLLLQGFFNFELKLVFLGCLVTFDDVELFDDVVELKAKSAA